jgi:tetratricopeptide (TPR) repeat protein
MRISALVTLVVIAVAPGVLAQVPKSSSPQAQIANQHYKKGWEAMRSEDWTQAEREFQQAIVSDPEFTLAYYSLGRAHMAQHRFQEAIAAYLKCRALYVTSSGERYTDQVAGTRRLEDKILEYRTALNEATQSSGTKSQTQSQNLLVRELQAQLGRLEQARDRNLNLTVDLSVPYFVPMSLGAAYFRSGRFPEAEHEYQTALEANPASGETHNNLAVLYLVTERFDEADRQIKLAEKSGFKVNPTLKEDVARRRNGG